MSNPVQPIALSDKQKQAAIRLLFDFSADARERSTAIGALVATLDETVFEPLAAVFLHTVRHSTNAMVFNSEDILVVIALTRALGFLGDPRAIPLLRWAKANQDQIINRPELERTGGIPQADLFEEIWPEHLDWALSQFEGKTGPEDIRLTHEALLQYVHTDYERPLGGDPNPLPNLGYVGERPFISKLDLAGPKLATLIDGHVHNLHAFGELAKTSPPAATPNEETVHRLDTAALEAVKRDLRSKGRYEEAKVVEQIIEKQGQVTQSELARMIGMPVTSGSGPVEGPNKWLWGVLAVAAALGVGGKLYSDSLVSAQAPWELAWNHNGQFLASASSAALKVWNAKTGECWFRVPLEGRAVEAIAFSDQDRAVIVADRGGQISRYAVPSGERLAKFEVPSPGEYVLIDQMVLSPDGNLAAVCFENKDVRIIRTSNGEVTASFTVPPARNNEDGDYVHEMAFSPNNRILFTTESSDGTIRAWSTLREGWSQEFNNQGDFGSIYSVSSLQVDPTGRYLACEGTGLFSLFDLNNLTEPKVRFHYRSTRPSRMLFDFPHGSLFVSQEDGTIDMVGIGNGKNVHRLGKHMDRVTSLALDPTAQTLASAGLDGYVHLWSLSSPHSMRKIPAFDRNPVHFWR